MAVVIVAFTPEACRVGAAHLPDGAHGSGDDAGDASHNRMRTLSSSRRDRLRRQMDHVNRDRNANDNQDAGASINGASDARGSRHTVDTPNGASDARIDPNGASDANRAPDANHDTPADFHFSHEVNGAPVAGNNINGAPDANGAPVTSSEIPVMAQATIGAVSVATDAGTENGAPDAIQGRNHGRPGRRTRGGARVRRTSNRGNIPSGRDGHERERGNCDVRPPPPPQHPPPDTSHALIGKIIGSWPYLSTLSTRQIGTHTWSDQLVPLIWRTTQDSTCEQLREALTSAGRGHEALTAFRTWWIGQGIYSTEDAVHILNSIALQLGVGCQPIRRYQYLQAPIQEHLATLSGAEFVVASDLVRTQQANEGPRAVDAPVAPVGADARNSGTARSGNADRRTPTTLRDDEEAEIDNSRVIERLRYALEQFRSEAPHCEQSSTSRATAMPNVQECIVWLTCGRSGVEQAEQVLTANNAGTRASRAMHEWWTRHGARSPLPAFAYIQGINLSAHPEQVYGNLPVQVVEDLIQAGGACDLIAQDLIIEQSPHEGAHRRFDEELVCRMRDELLNRRCWDDREEWLANSTWLSLPAYYLTTLEPVLREIGIDEGPFVRLNTWFTTQGIRNPREMSNRLDQLDVLPRDDDIPEDDELNTRIRHMLGDVGLATELRHAIGSGLSNRRNTAPHTPGPDGDTCVICWEGATENESDTLSRWPQCGHIIHRSCLSRWIWACHSSGNVPRCPICRRNMQGQPERQDATEEDGDQSSNRRYAPPVGEPKGDVEMDEGSDDGASHQDIEQQGPNPRNDNRNNRRGDRPIPDMSRWAGILASSSTAQWHGKTDQLPPELVHAPVSDLCPATLITGRQHTLAENEFGSRLGIECYPSDRDGITAALSRTHINARRQGGDLPTVLVVDVGGPQVQEAVRQAQAAGGHTQLYVLAAGQVASAQTTDTNEIVRVAHKTWGHRAMASISSISAVGRPWCVDGTGSRHAQIIQASIRTGFDLARTTETPPIRIIGLPPMELTHGIKIAATGKLEDEVNAAITRAQSNAGRDNLTFKWVASHIRRQRGTIRSQPGAAQMAIHSVEISAGWGRVGGEEACNRAVDTLRTSLVELQNFTADSQPSPTRVNHHNMRNIGDEWCVTWTNEEMGQAIHVPMHRNLTHIALTGIQPLAERFGATAVPVETGIAIVGCAPAIADAVLQGWSQHEARIHVPRRISTYPTHREHEVDARLSSPAAGHDLTWMIATGGQVHPMAIARALFDILGEYPSAESVCGLNPHVRAFEQVIQVTVPTHLRQRMLMGPGADGSILVDGRNHRVYPFTEIQQQGRHRADDDTRTARLLSEALRSNPVPCRSTVFAQVATMDISADEYERARSVPVMIPLGRGLWNNIRRDRGHTPAAYAMPTLGTHLALALWPETADGGRGSSPGVPQDVAHQVRRAMQTWSTLEMREGGTLQIHSQHGHGSGNVILALGPGDVIIIAVSIGGTINIRNAGEAMHLRTPHPARMDSDSTPYPGPSPGCKTQH